MGELPSGVVTFVFTDIEDSTPLFERLGGRYRAVLERHHALLRDAFSRHGGHEMGTEGDSFFVVFADPSAGVAGCVDAQRALAAESWPHEVVLRVRMGVHAGPATPVDGGYTALSVHAAARVMAAGNGGQIVVSEVVRELVRDLDVGFVDTGPHRLRGLSDPMRLFRVTAEGAGGDDRPLRSTRIATSNVPLMTEQLVGRDEILEEIVGLLGRNRCLTLTGTGGVGKTKLALLAAASAGDGYPDGNWFVDLQALRNDEDVAAAAAGLLQAEESVSALEGVVRAVGSGRVLLVLDNCEHLLEGVAELCTAVLRSCPHATILATSREPLGIPGEVSWRVPSLGSSDSLLLLIDRIAAARGAYTPSATDREALVEIARRLDGIPLALELAAARCAAMAPADVAARLTQRFRLLTGGRGSLSRHQTLEAAVMWSFDLLDEPTKVVFRRLAVFVGGWTLAEAETVAGLDDLDAFAVDDALGALTDKSLVVADLDAQPARYRFLETMRQFAQAELLRSGETEAVHDAHLATYLALYETLVELTPGPREYEALARLDAELDNARAALDWAEAQHRVADLGLLAVLVQGAAATLGSHPELTFRASEVLSTVEGAPDGSVPPLVLARVLVAAANSNYDHQTDAQLGRQQLEQATSLFALVPDAPPVFVANCAILLGQFLRWVGERDQGVALIRSSIDTPGVKEAIRASWMVEYGFLLATWDVDPAAGAAAGVPALEAAFALAERAGTTFFAGQALLKLAHLATWGGDRARAEAAVDRFLPYTELLPPSIGATAVAGAANALVRVDSLERAEHLAKRSMDLATAAGLGSMVIGAGLVVGDVAAARGDHDVAEREWLAAADLAGRQSRMHFAWVARNRLIALYGQRGDVASQRALLEADGPGAEQIGPGPWVGWHLNSAEMHLSTGDKAAALAEYRIVLDYLRDNNSLRNLPSMALSALAHTCFTLGEPQDAARLSGLSYRHAPPEWQRAETTILRRLRYAERDRSLEESLGAERYAGLIEEGKAMTLDQVDAVLERILRP